MQSLGPSFESSDYTSPSTCVHLTTPDSTLASAEASIVAADPASLPPPLPTSPTTCNSAAGSSINSDGVIADKSVPEEEEEEEEEAEKEGKEEGEEEEEEEPSDVSIGDARNSMAQRRSSYPFSSSSELSGRGPREWQSSKEQSRGHGFTGAQAAAEEKPLPIAAELRDTSATVATSQQQLDEYRARLARDLEIRELSMKSLHKTQLEKVRVSPILEEENGTPSSPMLSAALTSTSTESGNTVRGGMTPAAIAQTPSYPFPRMAGLYSHQVTKTLPYQPASPASRQQAQSPLEYRGSLDKVLSESPTPASISTFEPRGFSENPQGFDFPSPNLYDLSLMLSAEPGLDAWWNTVVQIMRDIYKAERVTLAIPADTTDIENVPWGQKATYNEHQEDELSLGYIAKASSASDVAAAFDDRSTDPPSVPLPRPGLRSRHSFTAFEENKHGALDRGSIITPKRPTNLTRSKTQYPTPLVVAELHDDYTKLNKDALTEHDATAKAHQAIPSWEAPFMARYEGQGRVLPVLQALDFEADPLIDHTGVVRVLERGRPVALTRTYPYLPRTKADSKQTSDQKTSSKGGNNADSKRPKRQRAESVSKLTTIFASTTQIKANAGDKPKTATISSSLDDQDPRPLTPKYEEYEQTPPSPWSQSPAPSPAVRADPKENPFFTDAMVDEDSFNPGSPPTSYIGMRPPEAIGVDNSWTVLHIPLTHVLLSKPTRPFKLDTTALEHKSHSRGRNERPIPSSDVDQVSPEQAKRNRSAPIAVLSILSPIIPYPSNLRHSLEHLAPHLATSFSLCRHYSNLETELAGIRRRRPSTTGFGAVAPFGSHVEGGAFPASGQTLLHQNSHGGSITSPSDYSAISRSTAASPLVTPGLEHGPLNHLMDRRQALGSPSSSSQAVESYFATKQRLVIKEAATGTSTTHRSRTASKDNSPGEKRHSALIGVRFGSEAPSPEQALERGFFGPEDPGTRSEKEGEEAEQEVRQAVVSTSGHDGGAFEPAGDKTEDGGKAELNRSRHGHSVLHSYGADFSSTFQSLPPSSSLSARLPPTPAPPLRSGSLTSMAGDMPPPSDRLKGLILDSLPAHVFVSLPQTGETVWVNSRFLSYRGQTVADLSADPWGSIHPDDREAYLKAWGHSLRTGEQFSRSVRIKRFDGAYRWFYARAVASKDKRGVIMQFLGSYMDIHDQHIAELKAARQEEIEASEAKHRLLANLIPQIIFTATEDDGITFANDQWLSYTGQSFEDSLGLGFMDYVHPDDLARCRIPIERGINSSNKASSAQSPVEEKGNSNSGTSSSGTQTTPTGRGAQQPAVRKSGLRNMQPVLSRASSSGSESIYSLPSAELTELARKGIIKVTTDTSGRLSYTTEVRLRSKTGEYRWHLIRCVEIDTFDFGRGASSYFGSATDINDHKLLEAKLKEAMESKGRFLSNMSHEIRTPLIGISGMVTFLQDTTLNEEQRDYTNTIQTSANSLIMIINDILDLSKVDAGMMKLKHEWFHTRSLIEDVNELVSTMAIAKRLELNYLVEENVPAWVKGDKVRVRQVLLNVIGNAIKFTAEGEVFSRCRMYTGEDSAACNDNEIMLQFAITDTGRGFTKEEAELIFKPFSQIDGSSTRQHGGSGLGLVISRQLVELHGGKMEGTAVPGKGSTFTFTARFTLPSSEDHPNNPVSPGSTASTGSRQGSSENMDRPTQGQTATDQLRGSTREGAASPKRVDAMSSPVSISTGHGPETSSRTSRYLASTPSGASVHSGLARFSEAAKASGQDLSQMELEMPADRGPLSRTSTPEIDSSPRPTSDLRPPLYSILIICAQHHSREATTQHIEMTLPKEVPHQITPIASIEDAEPYLGGKDAVRFTHIVLNLASAEAIIDVMDRITKSQKIEGTTIVILCDSVQRQAVQKLAADTKHERFLSENLVTFIYKPVKPSRFAVIFDPEKVRDLSTDRNRSTAQQMVENQKASYQEIEKRMGNKGYRVLLVEDNPVNQKVLNKYLKKIGVEVEVAVDGVECTEIVLSKPHSYYSLILCDLHMPRKDGYQACREVREWEKASSLPKLPIIALSANVMSDVQEKCVAAGFSDYVTKPVDFIDLSRAMAKFF
ncbi:ATPase-like, ATP-binding domain protein [Metarhizium rileyi]|uniref:histidine kinase n=1 Tax=Metarhizium rileyi (strain RCEF 4871) TaxID=1649241 RepID=A0A162LXC0_METRR|nr:ATPase-like, ATP-binding domain protein [Metarhizium rileyi RCEF 4871]